MSTDVEMLNADAAVSAGMFAVGVTQAAPAVTAEVTCAGDGLTVDGSAGTPEAVTVEFGGGFVMRDVTDEPEEVLVHFAPYVSTGMAVTLTDGLLRFSAAAGAVIENGTLKI